MWRGDTASSRTGADRGRRAFDVGPPWYRWTMPYFSVAMLETPLPIGDDVAIINPLYSGGPAAYVDSGNRFRISSRALLAQPRAVFEALCRLGAGRWTRREVAAAVVVAVRFIRRVVDVSAKAAPAPATRWRVRC